jgi:hypothetical protein
MASRVRVRPTGAVADVIATISLAAAARLVIGPVFLNFDAFYALIWGDQLMHGRTPDYFSPDAPAPHPLGIAVGALLSPLGPALRIGALNAVGPLAVGAMAVGLYRLGEALYSRPVGILAAAIMATRVPTLVFGAGAYIDIPTAALVVWAAVLEARRRRCGAAVLALLAVAGLLRAEVWLFSLVYLIWLLPGRAAADRVRAAAIAAIGPVVWLLSNALITGSPVKPSHGARLAIAERLVGYPDPGSRTGLLAVPDALARDMGNWLRPVPLAVAIEGLVIGGVLLRRATCLPLAVAAVNVAGFACIGLIGLTIEQRYLAPTAAVLALLAAVGAVGWVTLPGDRSAAPWALIGACAITALVAQAALIDVPRIGDARTARGVENRLQADLRDLVVHSAGRAALRRARAVNVPNPRLRPQLAVWTGRDPRAFTTNPDTRPAPRALVAPRTLEAQRYVAAATTAPAGYTRAAATRSWILWRRR